MQADRLHPQVMKMGTLHQSVILDNKAWIPAYYLRGWIQSFLAFSPSPQPSPTMERGGIGNDGFGKGVDYFHIDDRSVAA